MKAELHILAVTFVSSLLLACPVENENSRPRNDANANTAVDTGPMIFQDAQTPPPEDAGLASDGGQAMDAGLPVDAGQSDPCRGNYSQATLPVSYVPVETTYSPMQIDGQPENTWHRPNVSFSVYPPRVEVQRDQLFILLPGSGSAPQRGGWVMRGAAYVGYHVIGLAFSNSGSVSDMCQTLSTDLEIRTCHGQVLYERIYGDDGTDQSSDLVSVDEKNSVIGRLKLLLDHLRVSKPNGAWDQYLTSAGEPDWSKIAISGASQGGKVATYISRDFEVSRAVLFNAMGSAFRGSGATPVILGEWSLEPRNTGPGRVFGIWHEREAANNYAPLLLAAYGVDAYGTTHDVDSSAPPFSCSHMLRTNLEPGDNNPANSGGNCTAHPSVAADNCVALDNNGVPVLMPTYLYMMTFPTDG